MAPSGQLTSPALQALLQDGTLTGSWTLDPARSTVQLKTRHTWGLRPLHGVFHRVTGSGSVTAAGDVTKQTHRQRCRGILHPPGALGKAGQRGHHAAGDRSHRTGRQNLPVKPTSPNVRVVLHRARDRRNARAGVR